MERDNEVKNIMVVGGAGYIGTKLCNTLLNRGYNVTVIDLMWFGNNLDSRATVVKKDVFDLDGSDLKDTDIVIFVAGLSNDPMAEYSPSENFISNSAAPAYLAYIAKGAGVSRMIYASSCSVYGYAVSEFYDEEGPTIANYPYGLSKLQGERSVIEMANEDFSVIAFRKGTVSGYSPRMRLDLVVNTMFKCAMDTGVITVNNPTIWRPILDIDDCITAYVRAVESDNTVSGVFNLASENCTVGQIADVVSSRIKEKTGREIKLEIKNIKDIRNYKVNFDKIKTLLGYSPMGGVTHIVDDLIDNIDKFSDFDNDNYYNIKTFKKEH
jgi:nucleoside-diphosphate-sugar epimerase